MAFDGSSPIFFVVVSTSAPELRIAGRPDPATNGQVLEQMTPVNERAIEFSFEDCEREHDVLKLKLDNYDLSLFDHPAWVKGNTVKFLFGYPGRIRGPLYALVDSWKGALTLEVTSFEFLSLSNVMKDRLFENMTRTGVIRELVTEGSFPGVTRVDIDESLTEDEGKRDWTQARQTDWQFVQRLAEDPAYECFIEGDTLHFHPRRLNTPPVRRYEYAYGSGQILDFEISDFRTIDRAAEVEVDGWDPDEREEVSSTGSDSTTPRDTLGNQGTLALTTLTADKDTGGLIAGKKIVTTPESNPATVQNTADGHYRQGEQQEVKMTLKIVGDPLLKAKQVIEIVGLSNTLSGNYYIEKAVHTIDSSGYVTELHLIRNALTSMPTSDPPSLDPTQANENRKTVPADPRLRIIADPVTGELYQDVQ
jgi:phage protein D